MFTLNYDFNFFQLNEFPFKDLKVSPASNDLNISDYR